MRLLLLCLALYVVALDGKNVLAQAPAVAIDKKQPQALQGNPQQHYMLHCQGCHLADGSGLPGSVPSMQNFVGKFLAVPGGREYLVQVPGSSQSSLSDAQLARLLNWLLPRMSTPDLDFQPYSATEVHQLRTRPLLNIPATRAALVSGFSNP